MTVRAHAKINLTLEVFGRRTDGYHALRSVVMPVSLCDTLEIAPAEGLSCDTGYADDLCLKASLHKYGGDGYDYVFGHFAMMMRMEGIPEDDVRRLLDENPKRFLFGD